MRILHVLDHSLPLHSGYTFRTQSILRAQRRLGWQVMGLTTPRHRLAGADMDIIDGVEIHRTPAPATQRPILRELAEMRATEQRLDALVRTFRPDLLHAHSPLLTAVPALRVGHRHGIPVAYEVRATWEDAAASAGQCREGGPRWLATRWLETWVFNRVDAIFPLCDGVLQDIAARGIPARKMTIIPNGVDLDLHQPLPPPTEAAKARFGLSGRTVFGFVGSFYGYEGLDLLISACAALVRRGHRVGLLLAGGGPEEERLRALAASLDLGDAVCFPGRVPHEDVPSCYAAIDAMVFARRRRRITELVTPLKPLEAMGQGKPVIASNVGGHRELFQRGDCPALLFAPDDENALADALVHVAALGAERRAGLGRDGRRYVESHFGWDASVARYVPVYQALASGRGADAPVAPQATVNGGRSW